VFVAAVMVWLAVMTFGPIAPAVVLAAAFVGGGLIWWARVIEPRAFGRRPGWPAPAERDDGIGPPAADHVAFARALAAVADRYVAACEHEARTRTAGRQVTDLDCDPLDLPPTPEPTLR
jgi:hypothetical protein